MEECSLDLRDIPFGFLVGEGQFFPNSFKNIFFHIK